MRRHESCRCAFPPRPVLRRARSSCLPLAVVPFVFSFQQFAEGFVWVGLGNEDAALVRASSLAFLAVALGFWPFWVPFSVLFLERRRMGKWCLAVGALFGLALGCVLYLPMALDAGEWLGVTVVHHSIRYNPRGLPVFDILPHEFWDAAYGAFVLSPFLLASVEGRFAVFRLLLTVSVAVSFVAFREAFVSVWCFFAALLSSQLCYVFYKLDRT